MDSEGCSIARHIGRRARRIALIVLGAGWAVTLPLDGLPRLAAFEATQLSAQVEWARR